MVSYEVQRLVLGSTRVLLRRCRPTEGGYDFVGVSLGDVSDERLVRRTCGHGANPDGELVHHVCGDGGVCRVAMDVDDVCEHGEGDHDMEVARERS